MAITSTVLALAAIALAFLATQVSSDMSRQRSSTCDGLLPMPISAYELGWSGVGVAVLAALMLLPRLRRAPGGWATWVFVLAVLAAVFAAFVIYTVYGDAPVTRWQCSG